MRAINKKAASICPSAILQSISALIRVTTIYDTAANDLLLRIRDYATIPEFTVPSARSISLKSRNVNQCVAKDRKAGQKATKHAFY